MVFITRYRKLPDFVQKKIDARSCDDIVLIYDNREYTLLAPSGKEIYKRGKFDLDSWKDIMKIFGGEKCGNTGES